MKINANENTTVRTILDAAKVVLGGKFTVIQAYFKKQEKSQINNLTLHLKDIEKEQTTPKNSRKKEKKKESSRTKIK